MRELASRLDKDNRTVRASTLLPAIAVLVAAGLMTTGALTGNTARALVTVSAIWNVITVGYGTSSKRR